jgi:uncharacterized membrane protein
MIKIHIISLYKRSKTCFWGKTFFMIGCFLFIIFLLLSIVSTYRNESGIILAFSILFFGVGGILYFFHMQFAKLEKIAQELEQEKIEDLSE